MPHPLEPSVVDWLQAGDPAIRWRVLRDLDDAPAVVVERERRRTATHGWGASLLARQEFLCVPRER